MKKLPKIYQTKISKNLNNNKKICYVENLLIEKENKKSIIVTLNEIFSGLGHPYNIPLTITTKNKVYKTNLIARNKEKVITIDNEVILINDIESIKKN